jgi:hypothetical protein
VADKKNFLQLQLLSVSACGLYEQVAGAKAKKVAAPLCDHHTRRVVGRLVTAVEQERSQRAESRSVVMLLTDSHRPSVVGTQRQPTGRLAVQPTLRLDLALPGMGGWKVAK